jgi:hypothetical protein
MIRKLGVANLVLLSIALAFAVVNVPTSGIAQTVFAGPFSSIQVQAGGTANLNPNYAGYTGAVTSEQTNTTAKMMGFGWSFTPKINGNVKVTIALTVYGTVGGGPIDMVAVYGTGTAPTLGAAVPGGVVQVGPTLAAIPPSNGSFYPFTVVTVATGLTVGTPYWFDLEAWTGGGGGAFEILNGMAVIEEIFG